MHKVESKGEVSLAFDLCLDIFDLSPSSSFVTLRSWLVDFRRSRASASAAIESASVCGMAGGSGGLCNSRQTASTKTSLESYLVDSRNCSGCSVLVREKLTWLRCVCMVADAGTGEMLFCGEYLL